MQSEKSDVVIIGAGLAGLSAGIKLAQNGHSVTILEKHNQVGGCATTFKRKDFEVEVGLHAINGLREGEPQRDLLKELNVWSKLKPLEIKEFYHFRIPEILEFEFPTDPELAKYNLKTTFPKEVDAIEHYFNDLNLARKIGQLFTNRDQEKILEANLEENQQILTSWQTTSVGTYLDRLNVSTKLYMCILGNLGYYSDNPYKLSLLYFLVAQASFIYGGAFYFQGGSQSLSNALKDEFLRLGGNLYLKTEVKSIHIENSRTAACEAKNGFIYRCEYMIANCAIPYLINNLLPEPFASKIGRKVRKHSPACSISNLYLGFNCDLKALGSKYYSNFFLKSEAIKQLDDLRKINHSNMKDLKILDWAKWAGCLVDYSQLDHGMCQSKYSSAVICTIDYASRWNKYDKQSYKEQKKHFAQTLLDWLDKILPSASDKIIYKEVSTPLTIEKFTNNSEGSPYGYEQSPLSSGAFRIGFASPIRGLFFASAWTRPGGGFTGALLSGKHCARKVSNAIKRKEKLF